ncbi:MAG: RelA/SpoT domain-containing protein [Clostridia bacterium]|nr:RelA/SpoT domain-containing protein [Clostridia bacterium]
MIEEILQLNGLSVDLLGRLSYQSNLGKSLKQNLHYFDHDELMSELLKMRRWIRTCPELEDIALDYRIKSMDSIELKYQRYFPNRQLRQVFNDILGFRAFCDDYRQVLSETSKEFRIVDMSSGKAHDDGYRGVHLYYQKDNFHYPIEVQFNTLYDRQVNNWLHAFLYKKNYPDEVGRHMRVAYEDGKIKNADEFEEVLKDVLHSCKG